MEAKRKEIDFGNDDDGGGGGGDGECVSSTKCVRSIKVNRLERACYANIKNHCISTEIVPSVCVWKICN